MAYYTMFVAIQKLYEKIESISKADADKIGYRNPGSLSNLKELVKESITNCIKDEKEDETLYNWFLSNELNRCIEAYNHFTSGMSDINPIPLVNIKILTSKLDPDMQDKKFMDQITKGFYNGVF